MGMESMIEPICDMPWDIYLDWLQDQGIEDLRNMPIHCLMTVSFHILSHLHYCLGDGGVHWSRPFKKDSIGCYPSETGDGADDGRWGDGCGLSVGSRGHGHGEEHEYFEY